MKLSFKRSGGFVGIQTKVNLDTANLGVEPNHKLQELLGKLLPLTQPANMEGGADLQTYDLQIDDGVNVQTLEVNDMTATDAMHDLFDWLLKQQG